MSRVLKQRITEQIVLNKSMMDEANMGDEVEVIIQEGAIFILPVVKEEVWGLLKSLGENAVEGILENPSENHNQYIYGERK